MLAAPHLLIAEVANVLRRAAQVGVTCEIQIPARAGAIPSSGDQRSLE